MSQVDVLLEHVLGEVLLVAGYTRPRFSNCSDEERGNAVISVAPQCSDLKVKFLLVLQKV